MDIVPKQLRKSKITTHKTKPVLPSKTVFEDTSNSEKSTKIRRNHRRIVRYGLLVANLLIVSIAGYMVLLHSGTGNTSYGIRDNAVADTSNPLDALTAADIAANVAKLAGLPEELAVTNQANTINLYMNAVVVEKEYVAKTQIMSTGFKSKDDIIKHKVAEGETVSSLAAKYGVTSDSIRWSNDLTGDTLTAGVVLFIPPVNGIVYTVGVGDTPQKLAETYSANTAEIIAFNDAEVKGLALGEKIVIPNGVKPRPIVAFQANYGYNGYWYGYCTWYVATKIAVPNNWQDANMWDNYARVTPGWTVESVPVVGAIAQTNAGAEGHVAIVEAVSEDGQMIKYSDMNGIAGWGREGRSDWVPASKFPNYIYKIQ